jgi:hypothetical protein
VLHDLGFESWQWYESLLFSKNVQTGSGAQPALYFKGLFSWEFKWPRHEADHSPPSNAELKLYLYSLTYVHGSNRDNFTFFTFIMVALKGVI